MNEDGFWDEDGQRADVEGASDAPAPEDVTPPSERTGPDARSLLVDFATGGLAGLLHGLDAQGPDDDENVEDPEALRRAEEAIAHDEPIPVDGDSPIDEPWARVATQDGAGGTAGIQLVAAALDAANVPFGWDPYAPSEAVGFVWPGTETRVFALQVPASQVPLARRALSGPAPQGVRYEWGSAPATMFGPDAASTSADAGSEPGSEGFAGVTDGTATPVTGYGPPLNDNERLERLARGGASGAGIALAVGAGLLVIAIALFMVLHG
jgi:hypothetical protein